MPKHGAGMPYDALSMGYAFGKGREENRRIILALANEAKLFSRTIEQHLPARYNAENTAAVIDAMAG